MGRTIVFLVSLLVLMAGLSSASTWRVEKGGSGDFVVVQDAVDAAASGDTILIGPGWFEEYREYTYPIGDVPIYINKLVPDLTIIGSGMDVTIIGPRKDDTWGNFDSSGICSAFNMPDGVLRVENLTVSGVSTGFQNETGSLFLTNMAIRKCYRGSFSMGPFQALGCEISDMAYMGLSTNSGSRDVVIDSCLFENCFAGFNFHYTPNVIISNCQFLGCGVGGKIVACSGEMFNCQIPDAWHCGFEFGGTGVFHLYDNQFNSAHYNMLIDGGADNLLCEGNVFSGTDRYGIGIFSCQPIFHDNTILKDSGYSVFLDGYLYETKHVDLTNNYWGTDNPDTIAAWISDANDEYTHQMNGYVDFLPFSVVPLSTEKSSLGGFKAMFRQ